MAEWQVTTRDKKSVEEHEIWEKDGQTIIRVTGFRWGSWTVTTSDDNPPEFERQACPGGSNDLDSVDMNSACGENIDEIELISLDDGWYGDIVWPDDMDDDERERLEELWEEEFYEGWEGEGWTQSETECWAWGEFEIEKLD